MTIKYMATQTTNNITLPATTILKQKGMVILPLREYEKLRNNAVPTYYLKGREAKRLDSLVQEGIKEYRAEKCKTIKSLSDLD